MLADVDVVCFCVGDIIINLDGSYAECMQGDRLLHREHQAANAANRGWILLCVLVWKMLLGDTRVCVTISPIDRCDVALILCFFVAHSTYLRWITFSYKPYTRVLWHPDYQAPYPPSHLALRGVF